MKNEIEKVAQWIKQYVTDAGATGVVIGLSGGVDSAVSAALAVRGGVRVFPYALPCESAAADLADARLVAQFLGLSLVECDLRPAYTVCRDTMLPMEGPDPMVFANIKARLRMTTLYAQANHLHCLVLGTGNRSELEVGYITKWGDGAVDFEPLGQYYKTEVVKMAEALGLPEKICCRVPSPGLIEGVTDESELGMPYEKLDEILIALNGCQGQPIPCLGPDVGTESIRRVLDLVRNARHKKCMPPSCPR